MLEGSTLGAKVFVRHLREHFGASVANATRYHEGYGDRNGAMWRSLKALMEQHVAHSNIAGARMLRTASATFESPARWLAEPSRQRAS